MHLIISFFLVVIEEDVIRQSNSVVIRLEVVVFHRHLLHTWQSTKQSETRRGCLMCRIQARKCLRTRLGRIAGSLLKFRGSDNCRSGGEKPCPSVPFSVRTFLFQVQVPWTLLDLQRTIIRGPRRSRSTISTIREIGGDATSSDDHQIAIITRPELSNLQRLQTSIWASRLWNLQRGGAIEIQTRRRTCIKPPHI